MVSKIKVDDVLARFPGALYLGGGGQRSVYAYKHPQYGEVVLKIGGYSHGNLDRVHREVETLQSIDSRSIPRNFGLEIIDGDRYLIIEERMPGETLINHLAEFTSIRRATGLIMSIVVSMKDLWDRNIIHRDLKPANIILSPEGNPKIIDFGIIRLLDATSLTHPFALAGPCTPDYASLEQLQNQKSQINHRADQFILGIDYAQLLLGGRHPFAPEVVGSGEAPYKNILRGHWATPEFMERRFDLVRPVLIKMLGKNAYQRFRDPQDLVVSLRTLMEESADD